MQPLAIEMPRGVHLRLIVRNHPGVMSHVCGLFARRAFNLEGIVCVPCAGGRRSVILLVAHEDARLEQVMRQLRKLEDVLEVEAAPETAALFDSIGAHVGATVGDARGGEVLLPMGAGCA